MRIKCTVKSWNLGAGFGFGVPHDQDKANSGDVFLHASQMSDELRLMMRPGMIVNLDRFYTGKGAQARDIKLEAHFTVLILPDSCSHKVAVRNENTRETQVFFNMTDAKEWIDAQTV